MTRTPYAVTGSELQKSGAGNVQSLSALVPGRLFAYSIQHKLATPADQCGRTLERTVSFRTPARHAPEAIVATFGPRHPGLRTRWRYPVMLWSMPAQASRLTIVEKRCVR